jgi:hypothetical protein
MDSIFRINFCFKITLPNPLIQSISVFILNAKSQKPLGLFFQNVLSNQLTD